MSEEQLTLFAEDSHAKTSASPEDVMDLLEAALDCGIDLLTLSIELNHLGWSSKTCRAYSLPIEAMISESYFTGWHSAGMAWAGECLTLKASDLPSDASVSLLSQVLETHVDARYFLSPKACAGILRRAESRSKIIPEHLKIMLMSQCE